MNIVTIGGGSGQHSTLTGLVSFAREHPHILSEEKISAIVSTTDHGGHTGRLLDSRKPKDAEGTFLPPGDVRQCLAAMAHDEENKSFFQFRNEDGNTSGNDFLNNAFDFFEHDFKKAIEFGRKFLGVRGNVYPGSTLRPTFWGVLENGAKIMDEEKVVEQSLTTGSPIKEVYLEPNVDANPDALTAIENADKIIITQGSLFTSAIPNLLIAGFPEAIRNSKAKKIYVMNITTQPGETADYSAQKHLDILESYLGEGVLDYVVIHTGEIPLELKQKYESQGQHVVVDDLNSEKVVRTSLVRTDSPVLRHDPLKLAETIVKL